MRSWRSMLTLVEAERRPGAGETIRIVLADDHEVVRDGLRMVLEAEPGLEVIAEAGDLESTRRYVRAHRPRTREFGLLRAVGATKAQVRRMVRYESMITAVIGGLLGTAVGLLFAFLVTQSLGDLGLGFVPPLAELVVFLLLAVIVGVVAAVVPARRGARLQVLEALHAE
jgi:FtsX-like permease family